MRIAENFLLFHMIVLRLHQKQKHQKDLSEIYDKVVSLINKYKPGCFSN